jgi:hypothetical protein
MTVTADTDRAVLCSYEHHKGFAEKGCHKPIKCKNTSGLELQENSVPVFSVLGFVE